MPRNETEQQRIVAALEQMAGTENTELRGVTEQQRIASALEAMAEGGGSGTGGGVVTLDVKSFPNDSSPESYYYIPYNYEESRVMTKAEIDSVLMHCIENNAVLRMIERVTVEGGTMDQIVCITPTNIYVSDSYSDIYYIYYGYSGNDTAIHYISIEFDNDNEMLVGQYSVNAAYGNPNIVYDTPVVG